MFSQKIIRPLKFRDRAKARSTRGSTLFNYYFVSYAKLVLFFAVRGWALSSILDSNLIMAMLCLALAKLSARVCYER